MLFSLPRDFLFHVPANQGTKARPFKSGHTFRTGYKQIPLNMEHRGKQTKHTSTIGDPVYRSRGKKTSGIPFYLGSASLLRCGGVELQRDFKIIREPTLSDWESKAVRNVCGCEIGLKTSFPKMKH